MICVTANLAQVRIGRDLSPFRFCRGPFPPVRLMADFERAVNSVDVDFRAAARRLPSQIQRALEESGVLDVSVLGVMADEGVAELRLLYEECVGPDYVDDLGFSQFLDLAEEAKKLTAKRRRLESLAPTHVLCCHSLATRASPAVAEG